MKKLDNAEQLTVHKEDMINLLEEGESIEDIVNKFEGYIITATENYMKCLDKNDTDIMNKDVNWYAYAIDAFGIMYNIAVDVLHEVADERDYEYDESLFKHIKIISPTYSRKKFKGGKRYKICGEFELVK